MGPPSLAHISVLTYVLLYYPLFMQQDRLSLQAWLRDAPATRELTEGAAVLHLNFLLTQAGRDS